MMPGRTRTDTPQSPSGGPTPAELAERAWSADELAQFAGTDDLHISPFRDDGRTYGTPTWIWSVVVGSALYVRGYNSRRSRWYQAAVYQRRGRISAAGKTIEVAFRSVDGPINDFIDEAYLAKYGSSQYVFSMISRRARAATVGIRPLDCKSPQNAV